MVSAVLVVLLLKLPEDDAPRPPVPLPAAKLAALEKALATVVTSNVPKPLYQGSSHWGDQAPSANGLKWTGKGFIKKPELQYADKNHGTWRKYEVDLLDTAPEPLKLRLSDAVQAGHNTLAMTLRLDADLHFKIEQENWSHGLKLFDGTARGTLHFTIDMKCESKLVFEPSGSFLPTIKYRFRVIAATPSYSQLKFTHVPGFGGEVAEKLGEWAHDAVHQIKPSVERKLIDKLTQKLLKAADTKEVQISLAALNGRSRPAWRENE